MTKNNLPKKGSILILAIILSSVFLTIGLAVTSIVYKELLRLDVYKRSQAASAIADTAWECALYQEYREFLFSDTDAFFNITLSRRVKCSDGFGNPSASLLGWNVKVDDVLISNNKIKGKAVTENDPQKYEYFIGSQNGGACAKVNIDKRCKEDAQPGDQEFCTVETIIKTTGYDACNKDGDSVNVGRVQRRLYLSR